MATSGRFRGADGGNCPPSRWKFIFGAPFLARKAPECTLFSVIRSECGETYKLRRYSVEKPEDFLE